jgi:hypothetical protein
VTTSREMLLSLQNQKLMNFTWAVTKDKSWFFL